MDYVFGSEYLDGANIDNVKTVGSEHTDYSGTVTVVRKYTDSDITDTFKAVRKYRTEEDEEGRCYDWYEITDHYRYEDKFTPQIGKTEQEITDLEIENIEQEQALEETEQALTDAEIAIYELQQKVG